MSSYFLLHGQRFALSAISPSKGMEIGKRGSHETQFFICKKDLSRLRMNAVTGPSGPDSLPGCLPIYGMKRNRSEGLPAGA